MKPTELKVVQGTLRKDRENKKPSPDGKAIRAQSPIAINPQAKKYFKMLVDDMNKIKLLKKRDTPLLAMFASVLADINEIELELQEPETDLTVEDNNGKVKRTNPLLRYKYKAIDTAMALSKKFGCSPQDRAAFKMPDEVQEFDPIAELVKQMNS